MAGVDCQGEPGGPRVIVRESPIRLPGPEDIVVDHAANIAFVAAQRRRSGRRRLKPHELPGAALYALDLGAAAPVPRLLFDQQAADFPFHTRGIAYFAGGGARRLFVINMRAADEHTVEVFDVTGEDFGSLGLSHVRTVADASLVSPNDLAALDAERFYVANDHGALPGAGRFLEDLLARPISTLVFFDGGVCRVVAGGLAFGNGVAVDHVRRRVYVAATRARRLHVYDVDPADPARLTERAPIPLPGCPDNLEWDEDGALWIGAHPSLPVLALYHKGLRRSAPAQVLRVRFDAAGRAEVQEVWRDDGGAAISGVSVAAVHGRGPVRRLLLGQALEDFLRDCELREG